MRRAARPVLRPPAFAPSEARKEADVNVPFDLLWSNHPARKEPQVLAPCANASGESLFENQCAIRMGVCFTRTGLGVESYRGVFCWHGHGRQHPLRAEEMARWLHDTAPFVDEAVIAKRDRRGRPVTHHDYLGQTGIVFFRNFYGRGNQGDHIDLWNGAKMTSGKPDYFSRSQEVWFWELS